MKYLDLGFRGLYFHSAGPGQRTFIEVYIRDVLPALRRITERMALQTDAVGYRHRQRKST
jgi:hypothetical protein